MPEYKYKYFDGGVSVICSSIDIDKFYLIKQHVDAFYSYFFILLDQLGMMVIGQFPKQHF